MASGRESPPPERQTGAQLHDPPASGKLGTPRTMPKTNAEVNREFLETLPSNPKGILDDHVKEMFSKDVKSKTMSSVQ